MRKANEKRPGEAVVWPGTPLTTVKVLFFYLKKKETKK